MSRPIYNYKTIAWVPIIFFICLSSSDNKTINPTTNLQNEPFFSVFFFVVFVFILRGIVLSTCNPIYDNHIINNKTNNYFKCNP